jgi:hypothetical protein
LDAWCLYDNIPVKWRIFFRNLIIVSFFKIHL